ncbi:hypothetical protein D3C87_1592260 [compost metagenome]
MHRNVCRAVLFAGKRPQFNARQIVAAFGIAAEPEIRVRSHLLQRLFDTEAAENLQYVRSHMDTGTEA